VFVVRGVEDSREQRAESRAESREQRAKVTWRVIRTGGSADVEI
jgi:hypothetical protein